MVASHSHKLDPKYETYISGASDPMGEKSQVMLSVDIPLPGLYGITPHLISGHGSYVPIWLPGFDADGDKTGEIVFMIMFDLVTPRELTTFISTFAREKKKISRQGAVVKRITDATFTYLTGNWLPAKGRQQVMGPYIIYENKSQQRHGGWRWNTAVGFLRRGLIIAAMMLWYEGNLPNKRHGDEILLFGMSFPAKIRKNHHKLTTIKKH